MEAAERITTVQQAVDYYRQTAASGDIRSLVAGVLGSSKSGHSIKKNYPDLIL